MSVSPPNPRRRRAAEGIRPRGRPRKDDRAAPAPAPEEQLAAALHAFAIHGYQGVSVRTLNRELGVSHNLLHQRYGSKEAIWYAAVDWGFGLLAGRLAEHLDPHRDPGAQLRVFVREFVAFSARHPDLLRVVHQEGSAPSRRLSYLLDTYVRPIITTLAPTYFELVESGRARPIPPEAFYYLVTSGGGAKYALDSMTRELFGATTLEPQQIDDYTDAVADLIVRGMGVTPRDR
ncbi:MAG: TetR/AcrR family transcriptional regulator [Pseudonocardiales bacterium]|jgi:AcrR family transcriptional regulator|nr:TetR/AcrR family transcriptional regulator [Pseudonocardiales bacterium]